MDPRDFAKSVSHPKLIKSLIEVPLDKAQPVSYHGRGSTSQKETSATHQLPLGEHRVVCVVAERYTGNQLQHSSASLEHFCSWSPIDNIPNSSPILYSLKSLMKFGGCVQLYWSQQYVLEGQLLPSLDWLIGWCYLKSWASHFHGCILMV